MRSRGWRRWLVIAAAVLLVAAGIAAANTVFASGTVSGCASATAQPCATTTYTIPTGTITSAATTAPHPTTPRPSNAIIKGYYDQGPNQLSDWKRYKRYGFNLAIAGSNPKLLDQIKDDGDSAWVQPDVWTGCGYEYSISQALSRARRALTR